jgi:hypothetical protein
MTGAGDAVAVKSRSVASNVGLMEPNENKISYGHRGCG